MLKVKAKKLIMLLLLLVLPILLTSCAGEIVNIGGYVAYDGIPSNYSLEDARADGLVVFENSNITSGQAAWDEFLSYAEEGTPCMVRLARYHTLDGQNIDPEHYEEIKDDYPVLFIHDLTYDGKTYTLYYKEDSSEYTFTYRYLKRFEDDSPPASAIFTNAVYYYLVNDADVTLEDIHRGFLSSRFGDWVDCHLVYTKLNLK